MCPKTFKFHCRFHALDRFLETILHICPSLQPTTYHDLKTADFSLLQIFFGQDATMQSRPKSAIANSSLSISRQQYSNSRRQNSSCLVQFNQIFPRKLFKVHHLEDLKALLSILYKRYISWSHERLPGVDSGIQPQI